MRISDAVDPVLVRAARRAEILDADTERDLAVAWRDHQDQAALDRLISAYMRLALAWASKYRRYNAPMADLVSEASLGLMRAAERFDPDRGVRFSTYANWWIKAAVQDYTMRHWSLVRTGSTSAQKTLFYNFKRVEASLLRKAVAEQASLSRDELLVQMAQEIGVPLRDVQVMEARLSGPDLSLNAPVSNEEESREWIETLPDNAPPSSALVDEDHDQTLAKTKLSEALDALSDREQHIVRERHLCEQPRSLESLGREYGLSKERIRQIEAAAFGKLKTYIQTHANEVVALL